MSAVSAKASVMSAEANKAVARRFFEECWNKGDFAVIEECIGPEVLMHDGEEHVNWDWWKDMVIRWRRAFPDFQYLLDHVIADGDTVAINTRFIGTHQDVFQWLNFGPWAPTGKSINVREIIVWRLAEGKVVENWANWDQISFARQLGVSLPAG